MTLYLDGSSSDTAFLTATVFPDPTSSVISPTPSPSTKKSIRATALVPRAQNQLPDPRYLRNDTTNFLAVNGADFPHLGGAAPEVP